MQGGLNRREALEICGNGGTIFNSDRQCFVSLATNDSERANVQLDSDLIYKDHDISAILVLL